MPPRCVDFLHRWRRWLTGVALLALAPKCLLCLAAYAGLGAAIGLGGPELCGATDDASFAWAGVFAITGATLGILLIAVRGRRRDSTHLQNQVRACASPRFDG